jgi:hypothetical protein
MVMVGEGMVMVKVEAGLVAPGKVKVKERGMAKERGWVKEKDWEMGMVMVMAKERGWVMGLGMVKVKGTGTGKVEGERPGLS